ncbi:MAG: transposase [Nitrospirota bacterium]
MPLQKTNHCKMVMPKYNPEIHHRRSIRFKDYDYSQAGVYFITICVLNRACFFGEIVDGNMKLSDAGEMIQTVWNEIPKHYKHIEIDIFQIMPNHFHGIVFIVGAGPCACPNQNITHNININGQPQGVAPTVLSLPDVVHRFKTMTTKRYINGVKKNNWTPFNGKLWQRNYYDHVIRNEEELQRIREYIINNPLQWAEDENNPENIKMNYVGAGPRACPEYDGIRKWRGGIEI